MQTTDRNSSVVTAILAASAFFLILAVFGKSVKGQDSRPRPPQRPAHQLEISGPFSMDSGYYHTGIPGTAEHHYWFLAQPEL